LRRIETGLDNLLDELRVCLGSWSMEESELSLISRSENIVYKVESPSGENYALRVHRSGYHERKVLVSEQKWVHSLACSGFRVPRFVIADQGNFYVQVNIGGDEVNLSLVEWLDGKSLLEIESGGVTSEFLVSALRQVGKTMALFHGHTASWNPGPEFVRHRLDVKGFFGESPFWGRYWESPYLTKKQSDLLVASHPFLSSEMESLGTGRDAFGLIHADMHHGNIFFDNCNDMHIIDFDDACFGWYLYDIAAALYEYKEHVAFDVISDAFLQGYREARPFSDCCWAMVPMFMHVRARAIIGWATDRPELENGDVVRALIESVCQEAEQYL